MKQPLATLNKIISDPVEVDTNLYSFGGFSLIRTRHLLILDRIFSPTYHTKKPSFRADQQHTAIPTPPAASLMNRCQANQQLPASSHPAHTVEVPDLWGLSVPGDLTSWADIPLPPSLPPYLHSPPPQSCGRYC
ncbi:hypothetical protein ACOMHN_003790 [Nucella lapillus]